MKKFVDNGFAELDILDMKNLKGGGKEDDNEPNPDDYEIHCWFSGGEWVAVWIPKQK